MTTESIFIFIPPANTETLTLDFSNQIRVRHQKYFETSIDIKDENYDIAIAMSSSLADPVLGHCTGWVYLNIYISVTALAGCI